jgi:hypothetical protein
MTNVPYQPHKLVVPALFTELTTLDELDRSVARLYGEIDSRTKPIPFTFTTYYDAEMGPPIHRVIYSFASLVAPDDLASFKHLSIALEARTARPDSRRILNLDPGLLSLSRLILATTKASGHRIPIGEGLWAEITLLFRRGRYEPLEWTYPDFRGDAYSDWLLSVRDTYHAQLRELDAEVNWRL